MTKQIPLSRGKLAMVDDEDHGRLAQHRWHFLPIGKTGYAARNARRPDGTWVTLLMHRAILECADGFVVDHIDHDGLNNVRSNMRVCWQVSNV